MEETMPRKYPWIDEAARGIHRYRVHFSPSESLGCDTYAHCTAALAARGLRVYEELPSDVQPIQLGGAAAAVRRVPFLALLPRGGDRRRGAGAVGEPVSGAGVVAVRLHPTMTLEQAAAWCATHDRELRLVRPPGAAAGDCPHFVAVPATSVAELPAMLRPQASL